MKKIRRISILVVLALATIPATAFMRGQDEETPRMKCLKKCQTELLQCITDAKGDEAKKSACNKAASACEKACPKNP